MVVGVTWRKQNNFSTMVFIVCNILHISNNWSITKQSWACVNFWCTTSGIATMWQHVEASLTRIKNQKFLPLWSQWRDDTIFSDLVTGLASKRLSDQDFIIGSEWFIGVKQTTRWKFGDTTLTCFFRLCQPYKDNVLAHHEHLWEGQGPINNNNGVGKHNCCHLLYDKN